MRQALGAGAMVQAEPSNPSSPDRDLLIVGCGYMGRPTLTLARDRYRRVFVTCRQPGQMQALAKLGGEPMLVEVTQPLTLAALKPALASDQLDVAYMVPPGSGAGQISPRDVLVDGLDHMIRALRRAAVHRAVMISSTGVYGATDGRWVDADTPAQPRDPRGQLLADAEQRWLAWHESAHVLRLAGIYGPGRIIGKRPVTEQLPLAGDPHAWLNLIHVDDAASLAIAVMTAHAPGRVELGADGSPVERLTYYQHLAQRLGVDPPRVMSDHEAAQQFGDQQTARRLRRASSKRCDPARTIQRTGWTPRYQGYQQGLEQAMAAPDE